MDRLAVFSLKGSPERLVLVLSDPFIQPTGTVVAAPLLDPGSFPAAAPMNPVLDLGGQKFVLATELLAAIPVKELGKQVTTCIEHEYPVANAINRLFFGI